MRGGNTMIYIAICDDDPKQTKVLNDYVLHFVKENNIFADVTIYSQSRMLQYDIQEGKHYDLILSDIEMPHIDGMQLAAYVKRYLPGVLIIFITSHLKYAVDAFELSIFRYVPKNSINTRLEQALGDAINIINIQMNDYYLIQTPTRVEKILYKNIIYIQREGKNSILVLSDATVTKVRKSLAQIFEELNLDDFAYIERGTIVNLAHIIGMCDGIIKLSNGACLQPSHVKMDELKSKLSNFWEKQI